MIGGNMHDDGSIAVISGNRALEFEAFDELPAAIRSIMNDMPLHFSAVEVRGLLMRTPAFVVENILRQGGERILSAYRKKINLNAQAHSDAASAASQGTHRSADAGGQLRQKAA